MSTKSWIELAEESCLKLLEQGDAPSEISNLWTDGESVMKSGLIPIGDAILGLSAFMDALPEDDAKAFAGSESFQRFAPLLQKTAERFLACCKRPPQNGGKAPG